MNIAKLFIEAVIRKIEQQQMISYRYSDSTINTNSPSRATPQNYTVTPSPQAEDFNASGFEHNSGENE